MAHAWHGKKVLVLGLGDTGLSCVRWLASKGAQVRAADTREAPPALGAVREALPGIHVDLGEFREASLEGMDAVVASPGIAAAQPILRAAAARGLDIAGDIELFGREIARVAPGAGVLGITGTNGKSTVTALAEAMARAAGVKTVVAGNIGLPVLDALAQGERDGFPDLYVIELSSYQLETTSNLHLTAGAMLNLTQDHLDRYASLQEYAAAKKRIFTHCETRVLNRADAWSNAMAGGARDVTFGLDSPRHDDEWGLDARASHLMEGAETIIAIDAMPMKGLHNAANALAAHALCRIAGLAPEPLALALTEFKGLPHRVELVAEARGVRFYDDSKGTNVGATAAALDGFREPVVLIAGGDGKGQDFTPLVPVVSRHARAVVLIGRDGPAMAGVLADAGIPVKRAVTMEEAVARSFALAQRGDAVLLSPACASFDMFANYMERGRRFAEAARAVEAREGR